MHGGDKLANDKQVDKIINLVKKTSTIMSM